MHTSFWLGLVAGIQVCWFVMFGCRLIFGRGVMDQLRWTWINLKIRINKWAARRLAELGERD
ncbi:hypothetical protein LCGC14_1043050 [marine sediment metagenome]|uniref:Uncharacterized protein n=1 Tax=marine sediment metagenome TaxID=412755 RepID=A0A0F9NCX2_9ZZZZ